MKVNYITPSSEQQSYNEESQCIFLAGPINAARDWQMEVKDYLESVKSDDTITVFSPRHNNYKSLEHQCNWETQHLNIAYEKGLVSFYLAGKWHENPHRGFARTTRFELGEWLWKYKTGSRPVGHLTICVEDKFEGKSYILHRIKENYNNIKIVEDQTIKSFCDAIIAKLNIQTY